MKTGLQGSPHSGEFTVDGRASRLYGVGSCGYSGGLGGLDLKTGHARMLAPQGIIVANNSLRNHTICGERLTVGPGSLVVIGRDERVIPQPGLSGVLLFVNGFSGKVLRTIATPSEPVDVLVAAARG